ncbi:hypothetical protein Tco_0303898 [Tanacetum coccineum]|uniref:Zinc finger, CCHC-type n=1 Tax=Tanacetum coccineum TaxID=301880 RepID=A0ABQ5CEI9_9ASTR
MQNFCSLPFSLVESIGYTQPSGKPIVINQLKMALNNAQTKTNSSAFRSMLEKHQLTGPNFNEWLRALKLVVRTEKLQDGFLKYTLATAPPQVSCNQALADWNALFDRHNEVACLMLGTMSPKLYQQFENKSPQEMITELQKMYGKPPGVELQELVNMFHSCKQAEGQSVSDHVLLMKSYLDQLATLNYAFPDKVSISFIFEFTFNIKRNKQQIVGASSTPHVLAIQSGRVQMNKCKVRLKGKIKGKGLKNSYPTKPKKSQPYKKERRKVGEMSPTAKGKDIGKKNCPLYLAELFKRRKLEVLGDVRHMCKRHTHDKLQQRLLRCVSCRTPSGNYGVTISTTHLKLKIVVERYADFLEKDFILQKESGRNVELDDEDILPSENTSEHPIRTESLISSPIGLQEEDVVPVVDCKAQKALDRLCIMYEIDPDRLSFNIEVEEHSLGDLYEPANYKAALSDPEFEKWLVVERGNAINE